MVAENLFSTPKTVYAAVHKHNNQKGFRAVQEAKAKNHLYHISFIKQPWLFQCAGLLWSLSTWLTHGYTQSNHTHLVDWMFLNGMVAVTVNQDSLVSFLWNISEQFARCHGGQWRAANLTHHGFLSGMCCHLHK
jgi:hypothetical protein